MSAFTEPPDGHDDYDYEPVDEEELLVEDPAVEDAPEVVASTYFPTLDAWVENWLLVVYRRAVNGRQSTWCPEWWQHPEAKLRLTVLWQTWEAMRLEPPFGMADWLRVHCDHHMPILLSPEGPFRGCHPDKHTEWPTERLPSTPDMTSPDFARAAEAANLDPN